MGPAERSPIDEWRGAGEQTANAVDLRYVKGFRSSHPGKMFGIDRARRVFPLPEDGS